MTDTAVSRLCTLLKKFKPSRTVKPSGRFRTPGDPTGVMMDSSILPSKETMESVA